MAISEGINAYSEFVAGTYLTVAEAQPSTTWERRVAAASPVRVVEDQITLSPEAQVYLDGKARGKDKAAPLPNVWPANLIGSDLSQKNFSGVDLSRAFLYRANLTGVDFTRATLRDAWISESDVTGANFDGADLRGANLAKARNLTREQLRNAVIDMKTILPVTLRLEA